jgi:translocation and assembly module TamA
LSILFYRLCILIVFFCLHCFSAFASSIDIKGISDSRILKNVQVHLQSVGLPKANYQFDQFKRQLIAKAQLATQVFGYYHTQVTVTQTTNKQPWQIVIELGEVTLIRQISIELSGDGADDKAMTTLLAALPIKQGQPLSHKLYENSKNQIQTLALTRGYFDFAFKRNDIQVYESLDVADINLLIEIGKRYKFGEIRFGKDLRSQQLAKSLLPFQVGDFYLASQLGLFNQKLKQTQYFRHVIVRPLVAAAQNHEVPIEVILTHKPRDNFDIGLGVSSDVGPRFTGKWRRPWVNSRGHALGAEVYVSTPEQYVFVDYKVPLEDEIQNYLSYQIGYQAQNDNDTTSQKWSVSASRHWTVVNSDWQRSAFVRLEQETFTQGFEPEQTTRLLTPGITLSRLRSRGGVDINWGDKQTLTTEFASDSLLSDINMFRITGASKWVRSINQHRFLIRGELGGIVTNDFDQVPASLRYFTGGDQSVRGFSYKTLSPFELDSNGDRALTGGQYLAVASVEYSYPVAEKWRASVFVDTGNASQDLFKDIATSAGVGAIWNSPIGPVRFYLAKGNSDFGSSRYFHLSMGPSL